MNRQINIKAKFREEPDYRKLARALLSFVERLEQEQAAAKPAAKAKPRKRAS